jgi:hypothetical protein
MVAGVNILAKNKRLKVEDFKGKTLYLEETIKKRPPLV